MNGSSCGKKTGDKTKPKKKFSRMIIKQNICILSLKDTDSLFHELGNECA